MIAVKRKLTSISRNTENVRELHTFRRFTVEIYFCSKFLTIICSNGARDIKNVDLCVINRVESVKISFVCANDLLLLDEDGVQFVLE